ncbi:MAG: M56 family metallopeptidase [Candidatus Brocadia sp.]|nr:M56 family metallopeptidase [Candidatus Brocadia sp.]
MKYVINDQQGKAQFYFALIVFINLVILSVIITGIIIGIKGYIADTKFAYGAVTCCGSICLKCFFTLHTLAMALLWICIVTLFIGLCRAIHKTFYMLFWNYRSLRSLTPLSIESQPKFKKFLLPLHLYNRLVLFDHSELHCAFTSGLWKPKIYLSSSICSHLTTKELLAVILHEIHHKTNKDPLKLFVIQILYAFNFFLPINQYLLHRYSSASEKAADDNAINFSCEPLDLASALVKIFKSHRMAVIYPLALPFTGENIVEDRIRRLLETQTVSLSSGKPYNICLSSLLSLFITLTVCLPLFYKPFINTDTIGCKTRVCHMFKCG